MSIHRGKKANDDDLGDNYFSLALSLSLSLSLAFAHTPRSDGSRPSRGREQRQDGSGDGAKREGAGGGGCARQGGGEEVGTEDRRLQNDLLNAVVEGGKGGEGGGGRPRGQHRSSQVRYSAGEQVRSAGKMGGYY